MPAPAEIQAETLDKFIEAWRGWTPDGFLATWTDDCTQKTLPFSSDVPLRTRADTETLFPVLMGLMSNFQVRKTAHRSRGSLGPQTQAMPSLSNSHPDGRPHSS